jgi:NADP-dependent 3-hydroxy acid dehydrogenase YdfG
MSSTTGGSDSALRGRSAVITGASRGIGLECARALGAAGARLVLISRSIDAMVDFGKEIGGQVAPFSCDLSAPEHVQKVLQKVRAHLGAAPDILVNNAGQFFLAPIEQTSVEDFERTLAINLTSQFALIRAFVPDMRARRSGHIVTIGSIADHSAFPENAAYAASKYGSRGLHEVLREELRGSGVRATLVSPGPVDTSLWDDVNPDEREGFTPRAQMLAPTAIADAVRYVVTRPDDVNIDELRVSRA